MNVHQMPGNLKILCEEINIDKQSRIMVLEAPTGNSGSKSTILGIPRENFIEVRAVQQELLKRGALPIPDLKEQLMRFLGSSSHPIRYVTGRGGWHNGQYVSRFDAVPNYEVVDPFEYLDGDAASETQTHFDVNHPLHRPAESNGSLKTYLRGLAQPMAHSRPLILVLASALAAPLGDLIGRETGFAFNLAGSSTLGKTLASRTCLSATTRPVEKNLASFGDTLGHLQQNLSAFGGSCVPFSDPKAAREKAGDLCDKIQTIVFANADGVQRRGMTYEASLASRFQIQLFNSEKPMSEIFNLARRSLETGDKVRLIDISIKKPNGIFDKLDEDSKVTSRQLAKMVEDTIMGNHGVLLPKWIKYLQEQGAEKLRERVERYERKILEIFEEQTPSNMMPLQSEHYRIAKSFALVSAAGCIAAKKDMFPVDYKKVLRSMRELFYRAVEESLTPVSANAHAEEIEAFESFIRSKSLPFVTEGKIADENKCRHGFRRKDNGKVMVYITREKISEFISSPSFLERVYFPKLVKVGCLLKPQKGWTVPVQQKGLPRRRYVALVLGKL